MKYLSTIVLLPTELDSKKEEPRRIMDQIRKEFGATRSVTVHHRGGGGGDALPEDRLVVFSATGIIIPPNGEKNPFQYISSLRYWTDSELTSLLENAEKVTGEGYYEWVEDEPGKGYWSELDRTYGFVSPIFLTKPDLANRRWRPWKPAQDDYEEADQRRQEAKEALLLGLTGAGLGDSLREQLADRGWTVPLLKMTGSGKGAESLVFQRTSIAAPLAWKEGEVLGTTLKNALGLLVEDEESEELAKRGKALRKALSEEKARFEKVLQSLAEKDRKSIREALGQYLLEQARGHRSNPELWEELYRTWEAVDEAASRDRIAPNAPCLVPTIRES